MLTDPVTVPLPDRLWFPPRVKPMADKSKIAPLATEMFVLASEPPVPKTNVPPLTMTGPRKVFAPVRILIPAPVETVL